MTTIRHATLNDKDTLLAMYAQARAFMAQNGNPDQWRNRPTWQTLQDDIAKKQLYIIEDKNTSETIGAFVVQEGTEPTYHTIEQGHWLDDSDYVTIHRCVSTRRGLFNLMVEYACSINPHMRIDTHEANVPMQRAIARNNFTYCGIIHVSDGSPRLAYEKL